MRSIVYLTVVAALIGAGSASAKIKVDFAYSEGQFPGAQDPGGKTAKPGWISWGEGMGWGDLSRHDTKTLEDIGGTGIDATITVGRDGDAALHVLGLEFVCDGCAASGTVQGDPIANSYILSFRHWGPGGTERDGSVILTFTGLDEGDYTLTSYHSDANNPAFRLGSKNRYVSRVPEYFDVMPEILVTGEGVEQIHDEETVDVDVPIQHVGLDAELIPSVVKFHTDGSSAVEVEYVTPFGCDYTLGGAAVLNAFILEDELEGGGCSCYGDLNDDGRMDLEDLQAVAGILLEAGNPFIVLVDEGDCGDLNEDLQIDLGDLQAVAGRLLQAGSPFIIQCD